MVISALRGERDGRAGVEEKRGNSEESPRRTDARSFRESAAKIDGEILIGRR